VNVGLLDIIRENPDWSSFYQALTLTGYDSVLSSENSFTVFAPANSAWQGVNMEDKAALASIVSCHVAYEKKLSSDPALHGRMQTINGKLIIYDPQLQTFNGAQIASPDHVASNGVAHGMNKIFDVKQNIWEYIRGLRGYSQVDYIRSLNRREMDMTRSVRKGVNEQGQPVYDTVWVDVNEFLSAVPLNDETQELTYIVLEDDGFFRLFDKFNPYFTLPNVQESEKLTSFHVCRDLTFPGRISDPVLRDTITNIFGVTGRLKGAEVKEQLEASNGRVYVLSSANIRLRDKIKPVVVEGENFTAAADPQYLFTRYKPLWASGAKDILLACSATQQDRLYIGEDAWGNKQYGWLSKTFLWSDKYRANVTNFWVEYKADVYSVGYEVRYVAYDDIEEHYSNPEQRFRLEQKLFISLPGAATLAKGLSKVNADAVSNNYLGDEVCFVGSDTAGVYKETRLRKWRLTLDGKSPQFISAPLSATGADTMKVGNAGVMTMWLCNTTRATTASAQGLLFLDYIKLAPVLPNEDD
jgi:hypothetical protein